VNGKSDFTYTNQQSREKITQRVT